MCNFFTKLDVSCFHYLFSNRSYFHICVSSWMIYEKKLQIATNRMSISLKNAPLRSCWKRVNKEKHPVFSVWKTVENNTHRTTQLFSNSWYIWMPKWGHKSIISPVESAMFGPLLSFMSDPLCLFVLYFIANLWLWFLIAVWPPVLLCRVYRHRRPSHSFRSVYEEDWRRMMDIYWRPGKHLGIHLLL